MTDAQLLRAWDGTEAREWLSAASHDTSFHFGGERLPIDWPHRVVDELYALGAVSVRVPRKAVRHSAKTLVASALLVQLPADPTAREPLVWYLAVLGGPAWFEASAADARECAGREYYLLARQYE
ncbi:MAG: hypothetical protein ACRC8S_15375 [Fimbriiglobus sp.]